MRNAGTVRAVGIPDGVGGSTKFKEREILVQHLLVPEDQLQLLLDIQRQVMQGFSLRLCGFLFSLFGWRIHEVIV